MTPEAAETAAASAALRSSHEAFDEGGVDAVMELCSPRVVISQDPALPWGGRYTERNGAAKFALKLVGTVDSQVVTDEVFSAGDRVVQYGRTKGTVSANGASFDLPECHMYTFDDGKISRAEFHIDSPAMLRAIQR